VIKLQQMIGAFWNIRGLNKPGRLQCISDFINEHRLDFVGIQETKKTSISDAFL
jgi:exonuclease III